MSGEGLVQTSSRWRRYEQRDPMRFFQRQSSASAFALVFLIAVVWDISYDAARGTLLLNVFLLLAVWWASCLIHELAHALTAHAVGLTLVAVQCGYGPRLLRRKLGSVAADLGWLPGMGLTLVSPRNPRGARPRLIATLAAGPLASLVLFGLGFLSFEQSGRMSLGTALVLVNGVLLLGSVASLGGPVPADFAQIVRLLRRDSSVLEAFEACRATLPIRKALILGDLETAWREAEGALSRDPENWQVRLLLSDLLIFSERHREALQHLECLTEAPALPEWLKTPAVRAVLLNNRAWCLFVLNQAGTLEQADALSAEAFSLASRKPWARGTRGAVLLELGQIDAGMKLLRKARYRNAGRFNRASNFACMALAMAKQGDFPRARRLLRKSRRLDPECPLLGRVEELLQLPSALAPKPAATPSAG